MTGLTMKHEFDIKTACENMNRVTQKRHALIHEKFRHAQTDFAAIVETIKNKYNPVRIWQWGSLLDERYFSDISDIDLAVEGICEPELFFALYGDAMTLTEFPLDIVQMEKIEPEFADIIRMKGRIIYERT
jgi:predicted nucleotidyltransferase